MKCKECGGIVKESKAYINTLTSSGDELSNPFESGTTISRNGKAILIDCLKCIDCGHSFI